LKHGRARPAGGLLIGAGEQASVAAHGTLIKRTETDIAAAVAWRERRLVFSADRLEDIAAEFSRYSPREIRLEDQQARDKRITGTFDADDPESLVLFLEELQELSVEHAGDDFVIRGRPAEKQNEAPSR
jgi:transmembrane sensor